MDQLITAPHKVDSPARASSSLLEPALLKKFDINGPRYTSYPSADRFHQDFTEADYRLALKRIALSDQALSLYIHLPFCPNICYYCACNKIITKDHGRSAKYIKYLAKEMAAVCEAMDLAPKQKLPLSQLHWGGGTPTFLSHAEMRELMGSIKNHFEFQQNGEYSIEIDPRRVTEADIKLLAELGFNRISLGVQDFNPEVQQAVHRIQTLEETQSVLNWSRKYGFTSSSVDLIYGLPKQTPTSFAKTVQAVIEMNPERLSVYSYAHLPHIFKPQRRIAESDLPNAVDKLQILSSTIDQLIAAGYIYIGMDHFARPSDELVVAQKEGRLQRNFQGYSTQAECNMLAFGVTAIGKVDDCYVQSVRSLDEYYALLDHHRLPTLRGMRLSEDDVVRRDFIGQLMCHFEVDVSHFSQKYGIDFDAYFANEVSELNYLEDCGLIEWHGDTLIVPISGRLLVRRVAMVFDRHLRESLSQGSYSKIV